MGKRTTDSTSAQRGSQRSELGPEDPRYAQLRGDLTSFLTGALSDTPGSEYELPPEIIEQLREVQREETQRSLRAIDQGVDEQYSRLEGYLQKKGQTDTSMERTGASLLERDIGRQREDVYSRTGQQFSESLVQSMLSDRGMMAQLKQGNLIGIAQALLAGYGQDRLAGRSVFTEGTGSGSETTTGFLLGELGGVIPTQNFG